MQRTGFLPYVCGAAITVMLSSRIAHSGETIAYFHYLAPPNSYTQAWALTGDGCSAVGKFEAAAILWRDGEIVSLGDLPGDPVESAAYGISFDGTVIVGRGRSSPSYSQRAAVWLAPLEPAPLSPEQGEALGVSADGSTIVGWIPGGSNIIPVRWHRVGTTYPPSTLTFLPDLPGGAIGGTANAVSEDGSVIVGWSVSASGTEAVRWTDADGPVGLGDLPGGDFFSAASDVSSDGRVVVGRSVSSGTQAFRWTAESGMIPLHSNVAISASWANATSADGSVTVGGYRLQSDPGTDRAFVWDTTNGLRDLTSLLQSLGVDLGGLVLREATDVATDGTAIAVVGWSFPSEPRAWRARIGNRITGDTDRDGDVDLADLSRLLASFGLQGVASGDHGDTDQDGDVDLNDLAALLSSFGSRCMVEPSF